MATLEASFLQGQLEERKRRLEVAVASAPQNSGLTGLLREVDSALDRMTAGTYGLCLKFRSTNGLRTSSSRLRGRLVTFATAQRP
jgi:hypothetical protein